MIKASSTRNNTTVISQDYYALRILKSAVLVVPLITASIAAQLAMHPLYGSAATSQYHSSILFFACLTSVLLPRLPERPTLLALASWLAYAPHASYSFGILFTQKWHDSKRGAAMAQATVLVPVLAAGVSLIRQWMNSPLKYVSVPISLKAFVAASLFSCLGSVEPWLHRRLPLGGLVNSSNIFVASAAVLTLLAACPPSPTSSSLPDPKDRGKARSRTPLSPPSRTYKHLTYFLLPVFAAAIAFSRPPAATPTLPYTRQKLANTNISSSAETPATVRLLARAYGSTGLVVVGEHVEEEFRFLRVDHSLLGGRWFGDKVAPDARNGLGDSIYSTFVLQEAVRLVKRKKQDKGQERALFIGLGIGVAAEAFIAHGLNTSVVEIDPMVYRFAREFFGLPEPAHVYLEDARGWVQKHQGDKFDYVVHDTFSGGSVPEHLYTVEFWAALQEIMKPDGVVAVNFAGQMGSDVARAMYLTLRRSFGTCRAFHDQVKAKFDPEYSFFNVVFFCTLKDTAPFKFREAEEKDFLESHLRLHILSELPKREMKVDMILGNVTYVDGTEGAVEHEERWVLHDGASALGVWQRPNAIEHWGVMREVLPDIFWETY